MTTAEKVSIHEGSLKSINWYVDYHTKQLAEYLVKREVAETYIAYLKAELEAEIAAEESVQNAQLSDGVIGVGA